MFQGFASKTELKLVVFGTDLKLALGELFCLKAGFEKGEFLAIRPSEWFFLL